MNRFCILSLLGAAAVLSLVVPSDARKSKVPSHPSKLTYSELGWEVPLGTPYREVLDNGLRTYIGEDHSLPLVSVTAYFRSGTLNEPADKLGLGTLTANLLKSGGTEEIPSDTLEELIERLAIDISFAQGESQLKMTASFLSEYTDTALFILEQMLFHPTFEEHKIERERSFLLEAVKHRFDNPDPILSAAYDKNMYPAEQNSRLATLETVRSITREDLSSWARRAVQTSSTVIAVSGDIDRKDIAERLNKMFPKAEKERPAEKAFPAPAPRTEPVNLIVHKPISQAYVRMGLPFIRRPHPDYYPMSALNIILGGSGFTSRLGTTVRSDAGLTYHIYSSAGSNYTYPSTFYVHFFTKKKTINQAIALSLQEIRKIVKEGVTDEELENAKQMLINGLPSMFRSVDDIVDTYAWNEYYGREQDHYKVYPDKVRALTKEDLSRVAAKYLAPEKLSYTIVTDTTGSDVKELLPDNPSVTRNNPTRTVEPEQLPGSMVEKPETVGNE